MMFDLFSSFHPYVVMDKLQLLASMDGEHIECKIMTAVFFQHHPVCMFA